MIGFMVQSIRLAFLDRFREFVFRMLRCFNRVILENFDNDDPRILTVLLIGTQENVKAHILRQHTLGLTEASAWSKPLPTLNCPDKVLMYRQQNHGLSACLSSTPTFPTFRKPNLYSSIGS